METKGVFFVNVLARRKWLIDDGSEIFSISAIFVEFLKTIPPAPISSITPYHPLLISLSRSVIKVWESRLPS